MRKLRKKGSRLGLIEAIVFDADGTLFDSGDAFYHLVRDIFSRRKWPLKSKESIISVLGMTNKQIANVLIPKKLRHNKRVLDEWEKDMEKKWLEHYLPRHVKLVVGAKKVLKKVRNMGLRIGLVSNGSAKEIPLYIRHASIESLLEVVVTADDVKRPKPFPDPLREAAKRLGMPISRILYVGDTVMDARSARSAGASLALVLSGIGNRQDLIDQKPDVLLESIGELPKSIIQFAGANRRTRRKPSPKLLKG